MYYYNFEENPYPFLKFVDFQSCKSEEISMIDESELNNKDKNDLNTNGKYEDRSKNENFCNYKTNDITFNVLKKNESRGRKKNSDNRAYYGICHDKYSKDNITSKIQVHYISFIRNFLNIVLEELKINLRFQKINYKFKKTVNKMHILKLKNSTIGEIICQDISPKYTKNTGKNKIIFEKIKNVPIIEDILSSKYLALFNIYKEGKNDIKLKNITINLYDKKIEMFKDFVKKNNNDSKYITKINECIKKYINEQNDQIINNKKLYSFIIQRLSKKVLNNIQLIYFNLLNKINK